MVATLKGLGGRLGGGGGGGALFLGSYMIITNALLRMPGPLADLLCIHACMPAFMKS